MSILIISTYSAISFWVPFHDTPELFLIVFDSCTICCPHFCAWLMPRPCEWGATYHHIPWRTLHSFLLNQLQLLHFLLLLLQSLLQPLPLFLLDGSMKWPRQDLQKTRMKALILFCCMSMHSHSVASIRGQNHELTRLPTRSSAANMETHALHTGNSIVLHHDTSMPHLLKNDKKQTCHWPWNVKTLFFK